VAHAGLKGKSTWLLRC